MPWICTITRYLYCWTHVLCFALCSLMTSQTMAAEPPNTAHPLDPLSKEEITRTVAVLKTSGKVSDSSRFPIIVLREPPKDEVLNFKLGGSMRREAFVVIYERASNTTSEVVVDLNNKSILSWQVMPGVQPAVMFEEFFLVPDIVRADPRWRSVLYRASLSEMFVPYDDPGPAWFFRNVFDMGEYGAGLLTNPLEPFADAPNNAVFFPAVFADNTGTPSEMPRIVALYERDGVLLWKHFDLNAVHNTTHNESRRARQLVLGIIATVGNYDYGFNWVFHQDGTLETEVLLSGIMQTKGIPPAGTSTQTHGNADHGHVVAKQLAAVHHQHFFNFRLDLDVDGIRQECAGAARGLYAGAWGECGFLRRANFFNASAGRFSQRPPVGHAL